MNDTGDTAAAGADQEGSLEGRLGARPAAGDQFDDIVSELAGAARAIGTDAFYETLIYVYRRLASHSLVTVVRYNRFSKPNFLFHRNYSDELVAVYLDRFYELDPFHHYWREFERPGIVALHEFPAGELKRSRYVSEFLQKSRIHDQLGMFMPPVARSSVAMFLERVEGPFLKHESDRIRHLYPVLAALHDAHVNCTFASLGSSQLGLGLNLNIPTAIVDFSGDMVFANEAWRTLDSSDPEVRRAMRALESSGERDVEVTGGRVLHRQVLGEKFCIAPGGWLYQVETSDSEAKLDPPRRVFQQMHPELSCRDLDIIDLILHGHSIDSIAMQLSLTRGTVKNYRRRVYAKLDMSTERELFLAYIEALSRDPLEALPAERA